MTATLQIPEPMVAYSDFHHVDPCDVAQFILDEHGRECAELLHEDTWQEDDAEPWLAG